ncbi:MAG TPA: serine hydrolase [Solirubrobacterales bacterium]|nr:serine hydrolase [Solirubrobacterales bacterium]
MRRRGLIAALIIVAAGAAAGAAIEVEHELLGSADRDSGGGAQAVPPLPAPAESAAASAPGSGRAKRPRSRYSLRPAPGRPPVAIDFPRQPRAAIVFDVRTGEVLGQRNPHRRLPIASLTKMLTALVIVERHRPDERVAVTPQALAYEGSGVGVLPKGRKVRLEQMLQGLLLVSGNDAAIALAQHDAGSVGRFVRRMNGWRKRLGLRCSRFTSPHGLEDAGNYACVRDLALLARAVLARKRLRRIVGASMARFRFPIKGGFLDLYNNNPLIRAGAPGITGVKTGYTDAAGRCYVITARRGGRHLGVVLLASPNPLQQVPSLLRAAARRG